MCVCVCGGVEPTKHDLGFLSFFSDVYYLILRNSMSRNWCTFELHLLINDKTLFV